MKISVFDITVSDYNTGNRIITESVYDNLYQLFPGHTLITLPYWEPFGPTTLNHIRTSELLFFGGGNILTSDLKNLYWGLTPENIDEVKNTILFGVGWWQYQNDPSPEICRILNSALHHDYFHSVRDSYTQNMLEKLGITNVLVTGCPTLWNLTHEHCAKIPLKKSDRVLFTLNGDYAKNKSRDTRLIEILMKNYSDLYFWPQGPTDSTYIHEFSFKGEILPANLPALDLFLRSQKEIDYIGIRLHAGVKALQHQKRSIIISIDNRAKEKKIDFNLPTVDQSKIDKLDSIINSEVECLTTLPQESIDQWLRQFN